MSSRLAVSEDRAGRPFTAHTVASFPAIASARFGDVRSHFANEEAAREGRDALRQLPEEVSVGPPPSHWEPLRDLSPSTNEEGIVGVVGDALVTPKAR